MKMYLCFITTVTMLGALTLPAAARTEARASARTEARVVAVTKNSSTKAAPATVQSTATANRLSAAEEAYVRQSAERAQKVATSAEFVLAFSDI